VTQPIPSGPWQPTSLPKFTLAADPNFPYGVDPALVDGYLHITPESVGLTDDPVAWVLAGRLHPSALTAAQYAEYVQYEQPTRHLRAVA
jgi:hypothetical protein